jgi:hypothetical protein
MMGQEIHDLLRNGQQSVKTQVQQQAQREFALAAKDAQGAIARANSQLSEAQKAYNAQKGKMINYKGEIDRAQSSVQMQKQQLAQFGKQEQQFLSDLGQKYDDKIAAMRTILGGTKVDGGKTETEGGILAQLSDGPTVTEQVIQGEQVVVPEAQASPEEDMA